MKKSLLALVLLSLSAAVFAAFPLVQKSRPAAEIVTPAKPHQTIRYAAEELQRWLKEITGATLPIVEKLDASKQQIVFAVNPAPFADDVKKFSGNDGYAVRQNGKTLYLIAGGPKGILNGVYRLLFKNSDIIWARPNEKLGTIFTKKSDFYVADTDTIDIPVYVVRGFMMVPVTNSSAIWQARNGSNWDELRINVPLKLKLGSVLEVGGGHNLVQTYITEKKYYRDHPDFFPYREGRRMRPSESKNLVQLCFTNRKMIKEFTRLLDERIKENPNYETYRIMTEDNYNVCECPECNKPIKLADGKTITVKHPAFQSTRFFLFLNELARFMKKNYPGKRILTFAYFFTEIPPLCPVESNIDISFCPIYKDSKRTIFAPQNKQTYDKFHAWMKVTPNLTWREYYGLTQLFPRPADAVSLADLRYVNGYGVKRTYSEMYSDYKEGVPIWDLNSMYYWVLVQSSWNPYRTVNELRNEFLNRVYGAAAADVKEFYSIIENGWLKAGAPSFWNDSAPAVWRASMTAPAAKEACLAALDRASKKNMHPNGKIMLDTLRKSFIKQISNTKDFGTTAVRAIEKPVFDPEFKTGPWKKAFVSDNFRTPRQELPKEKTEVRLLYDNEYFYVGVKCHLSAPQKPYSSPFGLARDQWPAGEKFEFLIQSVSKKIYQVVVDYNGNIFDSINKHERWNGDYKVERKRTADGWSLMISIPIKLLGYTGAPTDQGRVMFVRYWNNRTSGFCFWENGAPHNAADFGTLNFL
ncbi:MAG: DUF4838 domain-containing protein [Lentisphaeria bacterium]|nr:DUF4838 domain-containing protein [Lentisphaeria bacterium]